MRRRAFLGSVGGLAAFGAAPTVATDGGRATARSAMSPVSVSLTGALEAVVDEDGTTVYVAAHDGFGVVDVSDLRNPEGVAERRGLLADRDDGPLKDIYDASVAGDRLLVAGPHTGIYGEELGGVCLYDVSDPANPERTAVFETDHGIHNAYLDGETAYLTGTGAETEPMVVVDVSGEPSEIARWSVVDENGVWSDIEGFVHAVHDIYVQNDTAYVANWDAGTWLLDVSDPANPSVELHLAGRDPTEIQQSDTKPFIEAIELPGNSHYVAPNADGSVLAVGREAWDNGETDRTGGPGGITLWDVSDRSSPERLVRLAPPAFEDRSADVNRTAHNFAFRGDRLYTSWYSGGVRVYDVSEPAEPMLLDAWAKPDETAFWTAQPAEGGFVATSMSNPSERDGLSNEEKREPAASAELFAFAEPSAENARPARTGPAPVNATETVSTTDTETAEPTTDAGTTTTAETGTTGLSTATTTDVETPGFGVTASVLGGGLALARLLRKRS